MIVLVLIHGAFRMWNIPGEQVERLRREFPAHEFRHARDPNEALRMVADADVAFSSQVGPELLAAAPRLRWIHSPAAGVGGMMHPALLARGVAVTNSRGLAADTMAEHVLAVVLSLFRRLPLALVRQRERRWAQEEISEAPGTRTIAGSRVVIVGLGAIGGAAARRFMALGAAVGGIRRRPELKGPPGVAEVHGPAELWRRLGDADVVVVTAPLTAATRGIIGPRELAAMKPGSLLVNVSRGGLVDEDALAAALASGRLGGAALDVFREEPLPPDSPLWAADNLLITPHTSGFRADYWNAAIDLFAENLRRFERGDRLLNLVDPQHGY